MEFPYIVRTNLVIIDAFDARHMSSDGKVIDLTITLADAERGAVEVAFSAHADDTEEHGRLLHAYAQTLSPIPWVEDKVRLKKLIAEKRYAKEVGGIMFMGMPIDTGRDSQGLITGATLASVMDPTYICNWKTPIGWVQLDAPTLAGIAQAVRQHVQACFDRESVLAIAVDAGTYTMPMLELGWPT